MSDEEYKVVGELNSDHGAGVYGHNTATSGAAVGVEGRTESGEGYGLYTDDDAHVAGTVETARVDAEQLHIGDRGTNIVVYRGGDTGYAVSDSQTHTGEDVFQAAQQAIDARLSETRPVDRGSGNTGDVVVNIAPGYYEVDHRLTIEKKGIERITIRSPGYYGAYVDTSGIDGDGAAVSIDPGPVGSGGWTDRIFYVDIAGLVLDNTAASSRSIDGIYVNDVSKMSIRRCRMKGFRRGLYLRNVWQGTVDDFQQSYCGVAADDTPGIQIGHPDDGETHEAVNHVRLHHMQGDPKGMEHAYLQTYGRVSRIDIGFPNVELPDTMPGFVLTNDDIPGGYNVRGAAITGGDPAFVLGEHHYQFTGGGIGGGGAAIERGTGIPKVTITGMNLSTGDLLAVG